MTFLFFFMPLLLSTLLNVVMSKVKDVVGVVMLIYFCSSLVNLEKIKI